MKYSKNKRKGQILDLMLFGIFALIISISFIFLVFFVNSVSSNIQDSDTFNNVSKDYMNRTSESLPNVLDSSYAFFVVLSSIALVASAALIETSIIFLVVTIPIFIVLILANLIFMNLVIQFGSVAALLPTFNQFPMMQFFAGNWLEIIIVVGILSIVAFFGGKSLR